MLLKHLRDIMILPTTVTVVVPYFIYNPNEPLIPDSSLFKILGSVIFIPGLILFGYTIYLFATIGKGTLAPWDPKKKLIIMGPYQYTRNPMITGVLFMLCGESLFLNSSNILWWCGIFFTINTAYFIVWEEPNLQEQFGEEYMNYKKNVPRWLPRFTLWNG